jgi:hypothetical protein
MILPSKELLSYALGQCCKVPKRVEYNNLIYFCELQWEERSINIYELMHMMKEWALSRGYKLSSRLTNNYRGACKVNTNRELTECYANTEPEAIFKATSYIMEQLKQKD